MSNLSSIDYNSLNEEDFLYVHEYDEHGTFCGLQRITKHQFDDLFFKNESQKNLSKLQKTVIIITLKNGCMSLVLNSARETIDINPFSFF